MHAARHPERPRRVRSATGLIPPSRVPPALAGSLLALLLSGCDPANAPRVSPRSAPEVRRVVSLAPNVTEIVFALGAGSLLVGVSDYSDYPPAAREIPSVGGLDFSAERVLGLRPDLVLATREGNARGPVRALESAGLDVVALPTGSLDAVLESIRVAGDALGRPAEAQRLIASLERRRAKVRQTVAGRRRSRALVLVWPDPPQAAGGGTFLADLVSEAGAENVLAGRPGWPVVSPEFLATAPIEVLVLPSSSENRPAYERARASGALSRGAAARARVVLVDEASLTRPGPRAFDALEALARALHFETGNGQ